MRGIISEMIHWNFEHSKVLETVDWVLKEDDQIIEREDFALGYYIGSLMKMAVYAAEQRKLYSKVIGKFSKEVERNLSASKPKVVDL
jgi:hypothetical protein